MCLALMVEYQRVALDGVLDNVNRFPRYFYADDRMFGSRDSDWLQHSMNVLIGLFWWYGLAAKVDKSCRIIYQPGAPRSGM